MRFSLRRAALFSLLLTTATARAQAPSGFTVDVASREQTRILFNTLYQASENVPSGWTGSVSTGDAGATSQAFKDAINLRVNYFRAMAGVPASVAFSDDLSAGDQQAALMMSANNTLDHDPSTGWLDYTDAGAAAASASNLALGTTDDGPAAIDGYVAETGGNNDPVGHRRWLLYPAQTTMGTGDVDGDGNTLAANALWVLDSASFASPAPAARDGFVAWPPPGYVPYALVAPRWSFTLPGADFTSATVAMTQNGVSLPVQLLAVANGYGDNTLVWVPNNLDPSNPPAPVAPAVETATTITVGNVLVAGAARSFTYNVIPFDPAATGPDTVTPTLSGPAQAVIGAANTYAFNAVPNATGYLWTASALSPLTLDLNAENGPGDVTVSPAGTDLITTAQAANGSASYQFASFPAETMTINAAFLPAAGSTLTFNSQLDFATTSETASVQISTDGGVTWSDLYTLTGAGTGGPTEAAFAAHAIDLSAFAGKHCAARFAYAFDGTGQYYPRAGGTGWFVDDITLNGVQAVSAPMVNGVAAGALGFSFTPAAAGTYVLQVEPLFFGQYAADEGPMFAATAVAAAASALPVVTVAATVPQAQAADGLNGEFTVTRSGGDLSQKLVVFFQMKGSAVAGTDYETILGRIKLKPGHASKAIVIVPLPGGAVGKAKLVLQAESGYTVGSPDRAKVKIVP